MFYKKVVKKKSKLNLPELRIKLDQVAERIISRLKDRSRYKLNKKIYIKDAISIKNRRNISFLEFALEGLEKYHDTLGRYNFPDQQPIISKPFSRPPVKRIIPQTPIVKVKINIGKEIIRFYINSLKELCKPGDDPTTYGETAYCDADIIQLLNERINLGKYVAQAKLIFNPSLKGIKNRKKLEKKLRNLGREKEVFKKVKIITKRYGLNPKKVEKFFKWIIKETTKIEIEYLQKCFIK